MEKLRKRDITKMMFFMENTLVGLLMGTSKKQAHTKMEKLMANL